MFQLSDEEMELVSNKPEFGMGYNLIRSISNQREEYYYILNNKYVVSFREMGQLHDEIEKGDVEDGLEEILEDEEEKFEELLATIFDGFARPEKFHLDGLEYFGLNNPVPEELIETFSVEFGLELPRVPFSPIPRLRQTTRKFDGFIRVSSSPNDHAIVTDPHANDTGKVKDNTYATTAKDFEEVPSGFSAVGRYALPNPRSARYVYTIVPHRSDSKPVRGGTVRPANNQAGGGVEVVFPDGLPPGSAHPEPYRIPTI